MSMLEAIFVIFVSFFIAACIIRYSKKTGKSAAGAIKKAKELGKKGTVESYETLFALPYQNWTRGCIDLVERAGKNPRLESAFLLVKVNDINIVPAEKFEIRPGIIEVNINATDEEIIKFLTELVLL